MPGDAPDEAPDTASWRVRPALPRLKLIGAGALAALAALVAEDAVAIVAALAAMLALVGWAVRDLLRPVRLAADRQGVTVASGLRGARRLAWSEVERVRVDDRPRLGLRTRTLEIDTGEALYLFGPHDLGAPPEEVAARLATLRGGG
ncbi:MAG TPA: PH domain-containing protein [Pilimelia sp.]|nr:PH domain-containing protein [Pilimelia sp.]